MIIFKAFSLLFNISDDFLHLCESYSISLQLFAWCWYLCDYLNEMTIGMTVLNVNKLIPKLCNGLICRNAPLRVSPSSAVFSVHRLCPAALIFVDFLFYSLILPTVWLPCAVSLPLLPLSSLRATLSGLSSSWQSLLLLLYVHHPPTLLPPAALCQPCCSGAAFTTPLIFCVYSCIFVFLSFLCGFNLLLFYSITLQL